MMLIRTYKQIILKVNGNCRMFGVNCEILRDNEDDKGGIFKKEASIGF